MISRKHTQRHSCDKVCLPLDIHVSKYVCHKTYKRFTNLKYLATHLLIHGGYVYECVFLTISRFHHFKVNFDVYTFFVEKLSLYHFFSGYIHYKLRATSLLCLHNSRLRIAIITCQYYLSACQPIISLL